MQRLRSRDRVVAAELAMEFSVSEDPIRRDLRDLAAQGRCKRVYGGTLPFFAAVAPLTQRRQEKTGLKLALARKAVTWMREGQVLLIDSGSTNAAIAAALPERMGLTVIINAPDIAMALYDREGFDILLLGGRITPLSVARWAHRRCRSCCAFGLTFVSPGLVPWMLITGYGV